MQKTKYERFDINKEADGSWVIFDIFTGLPVVVAGRKILDFREDISRQLVRNAECARYALESVVRFLTA
jgi:hypothetical protein